MSENQIVKIMYSTLDDNKVHMKYIGKHQSVYKDFRKLLNLGDGCFEQMTLFKNKVPTHYNLVFDDSPPPSAGINPTMLKLGIVLRGNVIIYKGNTDGGCVDIDISLKQLKEMIVHTVEYRYKNNRLKP